MTINFANFIRGTLRAPLAVSDTVLQLNTGGGAKFNFPVGDYCFVTLYDRVSYEIVRYTSSGTVVNDNIIVSRGQDNTTAKAFPAGTCYEVCWNEQQLIDFVNYLIGSYLTSAILPSDTQTIASGSPSGAPTGNIRYTVNITTGQMWFWNGSSWIAISNGTAPPPPYHYMRRRFLGSQIFAIGTTATATYNQVDSYVQRNSTSVVLLANSTTGIQINTTAVIRVSGQIELTTTNLYTRYAGFFNFTPAPTDLVAVQGEAFYEPGGTDNSVRINIVSPPAL